MTFCYSFPVVLLWNTCACCNWRQHLQRLSPHGLHWPTVDESLDTADLTSVSLMLLGHRNATTGGSGNNLASVSLFSISWTLVSDPTSRRFIRWLLFSDFRRLYIYVWKLNQIVLELDLWAVKFVYFPRRDLNSHYWYTAAPIA